MKDIFNYFEVKIALYFAGAVCFLVFIIGLFSSISFFTIIGRIIKVEFLFIPLGYVIGMVMKKFSLHEVITSRSLDDSRQETEKSTAADDSDLPEKSESPEQTKSKIVGVEQTEENLAEIEETLNRKTSPVNSVHIPEEGDPDVQSYSSSYDEYKKVKDLSSEALGKHMIINDKKIINDPKEMAKAVRTMMNRE